MKTIILDPGHGMSNRKTAVYDPGATFGKIQEASIALEWANTLRRILQAKGFKVVRTRIDDKDDAPVSARAGIAKKFGGDIMLSLHCNAANQQASGSECIYRGAENKAKATAISKACSTALGIKDRGPKVESDSQHARLAVMAFQPCFLLEIGFIDHAEDRLVMLDDVKRNQACEAIAVALIA